MKLRDYWYKNAIIYCLDVDTFMDSNGDGVGDFEGLVSRLDELAGLGITCIWLLPFYPTPDRDNGYDVMDYYNVDPRLGTLGDFVEFTTRAKEYGIRVLVDLVVNHTSIDHRWFQAARRDPHSPYRKYYVWSKEKPADAKEGIVFPGSQASTWTYDRLAGEFYFHRFYAHQPDLNVGNPAVREEIRKVMMFWLQMGVSGFRLDAAPFIVSIKDQAFVYEEPHRYFKDLRQLISWRQGDAILLAEANVPLEEAPLYFGDGDRLHMLFHFVLNQCLFLALVRKDPQPLIEGLKSAPPIPDVGQWGIFLRNHDELSLDKLTPKERQEAFRELGPRKNMQIYNRGIRRRLAPMLKNDQRRIRLCYSLLFSLPGTPILWYGEELGMGDDLSLDERNSVRTPMQWSSEHNAGFSDANGRELVRPVINKGEFSYEKVNYADQHREEGSLLTWMTKIIRARKSCPEFGYGDWQLIETDCPSVFAHRCEWNCGIVIAVHNLSDQEVCFNINFGDLHVDHILDILGDQRYTPHDQSYKVELDAYGYRWFRVEQVKEKTNGRH